MDSELRPFCTLYLFLIGIKIGDLEWPWTV